AVAGGVELPAVVDAAQPGLLVAAEEHRRTPVRAVGADQPDTAGRVTERDQVLAEQAYPRWRSVRLGRLLGQQRRQPVPPKEVAHRRARAHPGEQLVD